MILAIIVGGQATLKLACNLLLFSCGLCIIKEEKFIECVCKVVAVTSLAYQLLAQAIAHLVTIIVLLGIAALRPDCCFADGRGDMLKAMILRDGAQIPLLVLMIHHENIQTFLCKLW